MISEKGNLTKEGSQKGAALVTVLMISVILGIACVALLSSVGANSRNTTDILSDTKAYYAAETGIQATINAMRYRSPVLSYKTAVNDANLASYLTYNYDPTSATNRRVVIGQSSTDYAANPNAGTAYRVSLTDPDNSQASTSYITFADFSLNGIVFGPSITFPGADSTQSTLIEWAPNTPSPTVVSFSADAFVNTKFGDFKVTNGVGGGGTFTSDIYFRVNYRLVLPEDPTWTISGKINASTKAITFLSYKYKLLGSEIELCSTSACTTSGVSFSKTLLMPSSITPELTPIDARIDPREPQRLILRSIGFGPNGARKELEAIMQKNILNGLNSAAAITMIGPATNPFNPSDVAVFDAGDSNTVSYTGSSSNGVNVPSFGFIDPAILTDANQYIADHLTPTNPNAPPQVSPPPALVGAQLPSWQQTPAAMHKYISDQRVIAENSSRVFANNTTITNPGSFATATGITFCDGDCKVKGQGGGLLIVRGQLESDGGFDFKGTIIVVGATGWERAGGGCGEIIGNVVIAPYTLTPSPTFLPPKYEITGGGCSGVIFAQIDNLFNGENSAISNHIVGVVEK